MADVLVKIKAPSETLANGVTGLQELTTAEIKGRIANLITTEYANNAGGASLEFTTGSIPSTGSTGNGFTVGTFTDTVRDDSVGTHPTDGATTTVNTYSFYQRNATGVGSVTPAVHVDDTDGSIQEISTGSGTAIYSALDDCIAAMVAQSASTCGQYYISETAPTGGTWTSRGDIVDTQVSGSDDTATKTLWQKTTATTPPSATTNRVFVKQLGGLTQASFQEMTDAEVAEYNELFRQRIMTQDIGQYSLSTAAPGTGTWQQMGETLTDQVKDTATYAYAGTYTGSYTGYYEGDYTGTYDGTYEGSYAADYSGFAGTSYTGYYTGTYTGTYTGAYEGSFSGDFTGDYDGVTIISTSSSAESKKLFLRIG